jgi:hypothetical protein
MAWSRTIRDSHERQFSTVRNMQAVNYVRENVVSARLLNARITQTNPPPPLNSKRSTYTEHWRRSVPQWVRLKFSRINHQPFKCARYMWHHRLLTFRKFHIHRKLAETKHHQPLNPPRRTSMYHHIKHIPCSAHTATSDCFFNNRHGLCLLCGTDWTV